MPERIQAGEQTVERDHERQVADAVHDERLVAGGRVRLHLVPEADQRERAQPDAFPADEHQPHVVAQHQHQHREGEQVEPSEEAPVAVVVVHVAGRVDVDQAADAGDYQRHDHRQRIEPERDVEIQSADVEPLPQVVEHEAVFRRQPEHPEKRAHREEERQDDDAASDETDRALAEGLLQPRAGKKIDRRADQRQQHDQSDEGNRNRMIHLSAIHAASRSHRRRSS